MSRPEVDKNKRIYPYQLSPSARKQAGVGKYFSMDFMGGQQPVVYTAAGHAAGWPVIATAQGAAATNKLVFPGIDAHWDVYTDTAATIAPYIGTSGSGLDISMDQTDNDVVEFVPGLNNTSNPYAMTVGTDPDFFIKGRFKVTDADGSDQFGIGWRKQQAFGVSTNFIATGDPIYTDYVLLGFAGTVASPNQVRWSAALNDIGASANVCQTGTTSFFVSDGQTVEWEVRVVGRKPLLFINGSRVGNIIAVDGLGAAITAQQTAGGTVTEATAGTFLFDIGDVLVPFITLRHDAALANGTFLQRLEGGHVRDVGKDPAAEV